MSTCRLGISASILAQSKTTCIEYVLQHIKVKTLLNLLPYNTCSHSGDSRNKTGVLHTQTGVATTIFTIMTQIDINMAMDDVTTLWPPDHTRVTTHQLLTTHIHIMNDKQTYTQNTTTIYVLAVNEYPNKPMWM